MQPRVRHYVTAVDGDADLGPMMHIAALSCGAPAVVIARLTHGTDLRVRASRGISELDLLSLEFSALFSLVLNHRAAPLLVLDVLSPPHLREGLASTPFKFFAGVRLVQNATTIGLLCVMDAMPRIMETRQVEAFRHCADHLVTVMQWQAQAERGREAERAMLTFAVQVCAELLLPQAKEADEREHVECILTAAGHVLTLTENIITHARARTTSAPVSLTSSAPLPFSTSIARGQSDTGTDVRASVKLAVALQQPIARRRGINLILHLPHDVAVLQKSAMVDMDRVSLERVLGNLITNALKFSPPKSSVNVTLACTALAAEVEVRDSGPGIPAGNVPLLYLPFSAASTAEHQKRASGYGLGLYVCKTLLDQAKGHIRCETAEGKGSVFTVTIPLCGQVDTHAHASSGNLKPLPALSGGKRRRSEAAERKLRILAVDDNEMNRKILHAMFTRQGHHVSVARNGHQALEELRAASMDAILLDVELAEGESGVQTARRLREVRKDESELQRLVRSEQLAGYFPKPFTLSMVSKVESMLLTD